MDATFLIADAAGHSGEALSRFFGIHLRKHGVSHPVRTFKVETENKEPGHGR